LIFNCDAPEAPCKAAWRRHWWCQLVVNREQWSGPDRSTSPSRHHLCRLQAALHGTSGAPSLAMKCPQRRRANNHHLIIWRVTELYGARWRRRRRRLCLLGLMTECKFRDEECADSACVGARRPCKALLERRARKLIRSQRRCAKTAA